MLKSGIVCPVFKNGGKPKDDPNSYKKITINHRNDNTIHQNTRKLLSRLYFFCKVIELRIAYDGHVCQWIRKK
jgi:hypothetical protein